MEQNNPNMNVVESARESYLKLERRTETYRTSHGELLFLEIEPFDIVADMRSLGYSQKYDKRRVILGKIHNSITRFFIPWPVNDYFFHLHQKVKRRNLSKLK